jgi:hypothetical protein
MFQLSSCSDIYEKNKKGGKIKMDPFYIFMNIFAYGGASVFIGIALYLIWSLMRDWE